MNLVNGNGELHVYKSFVEKQFEKDKLIKQIPYSDENKENWENSIKKRFVSRIMYNIEYGENKELDKFVEYLKFNNNKILSLGFSFENYSSILYAFKHKDKITDERELTKLNVRKKISNES